ncbi:BCCT family transporter [Halodesulfovibrio marinisediminis]|uniref:Betaine/carnitine transporter, BCCT family n=1 Tax=Halodesulfovibrio marinisediminis DSM 17456 TaxID=1121457 RepID=A0A1N6IAH9_9BACT|nr:BCCT family transporter [Halodesulfovibrio marinisediminis]SIO29026.1 betaine/carnitine transporter, BCCT family [Halodesulfovibrio marinisediminis DSM 17456]
MSQTKTINAATQRACSESSVSRICTTCFFGTLSLTLATCLPLLAYPTEGERVINALFTFITVQTGWLYMLAGLGSFALILWFAFGPLAHKRLGDTVEYSTFAWVGMLFCAGVGAGIMFGGAIDWAYYLAYPLGGAPAGSREAAEWSTAYGMFHWGPTCWAIYATLAVPIGYSYYVKKIPVLNISQACTGLLGDHVNNWPGKVIDILFMAGLIAGSATALGLGIPIVTAGVVAVTGVSHSFTLEIMVLIGVSLIFSATSYLGLKKGLSRLSEFNVYLALGLLLFVFITGPTLFLTEMTLSSLGLLISEFVRMATWMNPAKGSGFTQDWTVFYYAWFVAYAPFMSLFIAKISRGRTVRQVVLGPVLIASLGCGCFYLVFGNFGLHLQLTNQLDVVEMVKSVKGATVIMQIADFLPMAPLYKLIFATVTAISMATTFDAVSFALAATTTKELTPDEEPARWNRLFWALSLGLVPAGILLINGPLSVLQTASIVVGLPVLGVVWVGVISFFKEYQRTGWIDPR